MQIERENICFKKKLLYQNFEMDKIQISGQNKIEGKIKVSGSKIPAFQFLPPRFYQKKKIS